ncbi:MAG: F0F1 ATP synthase subunit A [Acetobacteraceae bacterium]
MAAGPSIDALGQFRLAAGFGTAGGKVDFTNSNVMMLVSAVLIVLLFALGVRKRALVPGRLQASAEMGYEFVVNLCRESIGEGWEPFFPFIFTLFFFILFGNLIGDFPLFFAFTSHIAVTAALAILVFVLTIIVGFVYHGLRFFTFFVPPGVPKIVAPLLVPIEVLTFFSRPVSLSIRLFANIVAGHVLWEVFAGFMLMFAAALGAVGVVAAVLPLAVNVALVGFEILVSVLQAYVFAILACIYLYDAVHLH